MIQGLVDASSCRDLKVLSEIWKSLYQDDTDERSEDFEISERTLYQDDTRSCGLGLGYCSCKCTRCNTLECTATHSNTLVCVTCLCDMSVWRVCVTWQHTATHCNTLEYTATHCNTLEYTATHCNTLVCVTCPCDVTCLFSEDIPKHTYEEVMTQLDTSCTSFVSDIDLWYRSLFTDIRLFCRFLFIWRSDDSVRHIWRSDELDTSHWSHEWDEYRCV